MDDTPYIHTFQVRDRVRWKDTDRVGTVIEAGYCGIRVKWDQEQISIVREEKLKKVEKV